MPIQIPDYEPMLQRLFTVNLHSGLKLGLSNIEKLNEILGDPIQNFQCIHVAGSNGKGSVVTKMARALQAKGYRVGLYTSPHISTFRERIQVNGQFIDKQTTAIHLERIFNIIEINKIPATFFEITTALAFLYFAEKKIDYAVLETGLGGRLDATNIVTPKLSIITSISLEHTEYLGDTLEKIAIEKAGIIKPGVPVIIGPCVPKDPVEKIAKAQNSFLVQLTGHFVNFDEENSALAKLALQFLDVDEKFIAEGIKILPPCRMEQICYDPIVILDAGHNPDGLEHLFQFIGQKYPHASLCIVFGLSKNKDIDGCLAVLKKHGEQFHIVEATNGRGLEVSELYQKMQKQEFDPSSIFINGSITNTIEKAMGVAKRQSQLLIVCGSFFIMSEARAALGIHEPRDDLDMNEKI